MSHTTSAGQLKALPLESWEATKNTLHLWVQIVGKVRMASVSPRNHWWHVPLYVDVRGLTTRRMHTPDGTTFQIEDRTTRQGDAMTPRDAACPTEIGSYRMPMWSSGQ
jgi:hypothetical protein